MKLGVHACKLASRKKTLSFARIFSNKVFDRNFSIIYLLILIPKLFDRSLDTIFRASHASISREHLIRLELKIAACNAQ